MAAKTMMPDSIRQAIRSTCRFHQGRDSLTSYATFSEFMSVPKMLDPDQPASSAPTDMTPAPPLDVTISLRVRRSSESASAGMVIASRERSDSMSCWPLPINPSKGVRKSSSGKSEKKK